MKTLGRALQAGQSNVINAERAAQGAQREMLEKQQLLGAAKHRLTELSKRIKCARSDLELTRKAVEKADSAAHQAQINAARNKRDNPLSLSLPST
uniref:Uncharacterized protein n=1 Tax=Bracon brevicornis TaxID=1563983 RepID=A0A6V7KYK7_9HYME